MLLNFKCIIKIFLKSESTKNVLVDYWYPYNHTFLTIWKVSVNEL